MPRIPMMPMDDQEIRHRRAESMTALAHSDTDREKGESSPMYGNSHRRLSGSGSMALRNLPLFTFLAGLLIFFYVFYVYQAQSNELSDLQEQYQVLQVYNKKLRNEVSELKAKVEQDRTAELLVAKQNLEILSQDLHSQLTATKEQLSTLNSTAQKNLNFAKENEIELAGLREKVSNQDSTIAAMRKVGISQEMSIAKMNETIQMLHKEVELKSEEVRQLKSIQELKNAANHIGGNQGGGHVAAKEEHHEVQATPPQGVDGNSRYAAVDQHHEGNGNEQQQHAAQGDQGHGDQHRQPEGQVIEQPHQIVAQQEANPAVQAGKPAPEQQVDNNAGHAVSPAHEQQIAAPAAPGDRVKLQEQADAEKIAGARNDDLLQAKDKNPEIAGGEYDDDANPDGVEQVNEKDHHAQQPAAPESDNKVDA